MRFLLQALCLTLVFLTAGLAHAHGGYETETEVRVYPDRMRIVTRSSVPFAWRVLGDKAPATTDEAGQAAAKPLLAAAAATLFEVTAGGQPLAPSKTDCVFESSDLHEDAAFTLDFPRPAAWPVKVKATFFPLLGELDSGTFAVYDHASLFERDIEPILDRSISLQSPAITFDLGGAAKEATAPAPSPAAPAPAPVAAPAPPARPWLIPLCFAIALLAAVLIRAARKPRSTP